MPVPLLPVKARELFAHEDVDTFYLEYDDERSGGFEPLKYVAEGFLYLGGAFMIAVLLVVVGAKQILINTLGTAFFFRLHLTIVPCVLMIPILVGIAYVIPMYQFEKMSRESIVERIRKE